MQNGTERRYHPQIAAATVAADELELVHGSHVALARATFTIPPGAVTALIGPNGAGKSTLLHAIAGLLAPRSGRLEVDAGPTGVAYVLQGTPVPRHLPLTVRETVTMGRYASAGPWRRLRAEDHARVDEAMAALGIADLGDQALHRLSGGQRQRAFVAQGLAQDSTLLLLDEPITGLDLVSRQLILDAIEGERAKGRAVVVSTHDLGDAARADHLLLLAGRLVAEGPPDAVLTAELLTEAYGGHVLRLGDNTLILDDHAHH